jgi:hypothetical protein
VLAFSATAVAAAPAPQDREPLQREKPSSVPVPPKPVATPEINLAGAPAALMLLAGSIAILSGPRQRRRTLIGTGSLLPS